MYIAAPNLGYLEIIEQNQSFPPDSIEILSLGAPMLTVVKLAGLSLVPVVHP